jgi:DNA repair protein RadC
MENTKQTSLHQVAEIQLIYKSKVKPSERPRITHSKDAFELLMQCWDENKLEFVEQFKILLTNRAHKVLGILDISTGGVSGTVADPKIIFAAALKASASGIILAHNHPSGNLNPSHADISLTKKNNGGWQGP